MDERDLKARIRREMEHALAARRAGNEGRARVCARRAAGWAVNYHAPAGSMDDELGSAYEGLRWLQAQDGIADPVRAAARRLTTRLTPEHELPFHEDPLLDAERVIEYVLAGGWRDFPAS